MPRTPEAPHGPLHEARKCRGVVAASETGEPASRAQLGFGFPSFGPRRTYRFILRWRTFSASPYLRWHAFQTKPPRKAL